MTSIKIFFSLDLACPIVKDSQRKFRRGKNFSLYLPPPHTHPKWDSGTSGSGVTFAMRSCRSWTIRETSKICFSRKTLPARTVSDKSSFPCSLKNYVFAYLYSGTITSCFILVLSPLNISGFRKIYYVRQKWLGKGTWGVEQTDWL